MTLRLAWLGVGHLARYCVPPLVARFGVGALTLSPRGSGASAELARDLGLAVAADNAALVGGADVVFLAPRPGDAVAAAEGLPWRQGQIVISLCAGLPIPTLAPAVAPATLVPAMPMLAARWHESPTPLYPALPEAVEVLAAWGPVIPVPDEAAFETAAAGSVINSWLMRLLADLTDALAKGGLTPETARLLMAQTFRAAGTNGREDVATPLAEIWQTLCSPGSFSRKGVAMLDAAGALAPWPAAVQRTLELLRKPG